MALLLLLRMLLLGAGLGPASAQEFRLRDVVRGNYDMAKVSGTWYTISMASDDMKRIGRDGDLRVYIRDIHNLDNGGLKFRFFFSVQGGCEPVDIVCEKTDKVGVYTLAYGGDNRVLVAETDYHLYVTFHLHNVRNGSATQVLALYGLRPCAAGTGWGPGTLSPSPATTRVPGSRCPPGRRFVRPLLGGGTGGIRDLPPKAAWPRRTAGLTCHSGGHGRGPELAP
ncbi:epididymal-specific lipocalin-9 [Talpa occidentalis]|uniref:epididymal-specific lipocalin-9 n=1 Tax=Talpa occidentalis TaxID=50954 RepID=UPI0023F87FBC|nr:epididymal-specific lipocalin-9 [Talpa occidentalis]